MVLQKFTESFYLWESLSYYNGQFFAVWTGIKNYFFALQRRKFSELMAMDRKKISPSPYNGHFWSELAGAEKIFLHFTTDNLDGFVSRFRKDLLINFYRVTDPGSNGHWYRETWDVMWKIPLHFTTDISEREIKCGAEKIVLPPYNGQIFCEFGGKEKIIPSLYNGHFLAKRLHHFEKKFVMIKTKPFILQRTSFAENLAVLLKISLHLITDIRRRKIKCAAKKFFTIQRAFLSQKAGVLLNFPFTLQRTFFSQKAGVP